MPGFPPTAKDRTDAVTIRWTLAGVVVALMFGVAARAAGPSEAPPSTDPGPSALPGSAQAKSKFFEDVAHSTGTTAVYIQVGNAWFRP